MPEIDQSRFSFEPPNHLPNEQIQHRSIDRVPIEVFGHIFLLVGEMEKDRWICIPSSGSARDRYPFSLSQVSRQWRRAALSCSALWAYISLTLRVAKKEFHTSYLSEVLARLNGQDVILSIKGCCSSRWPGNNSADLELVQLADFIPHLPWNQISRFTWSSLRIEELLEVLDRARNLKYFEIDGEFQDPDDRESSLFLAFAQGPSLQTRLIHSRHISDALQMCSSCSSSLTTLYINNIDVQYEMDLEVMQEICSFISTTPTLLSLHLGRRSYGHTEPDQKDGLVCMFRLILSSLRLGDGTPSLPYLRSLTLENMVLHCEVIRDLGATISSYVAGGTINRVLITFNIMGTSQCFLIESHFTPLEGQSDAWRGVQRCIERYKGALEIGAIWDGDRYGNIWAE